MITRKFGGGRPPTGTPSLGWSTVVVVASLLGGASIVHNIYKPNLTLPPVESPAGPTKHQQGLGFQSRRGRSPMEILSESLMSLFLFSLSQLLLVMVPWLLPWLSLIAMLPVSAFVLVATIGLGRFSRRMLGVSQSALAVVVFHLLFMWGVYIAMIREDITKSLRTHKVGFENDLPGNLVISTLLFSVLQLLWQVVFLMWNIYCICANIKTDEWINWKKYPEFQLVMQPHPGISELKFSNPYNKGITGNIRDFLNPMEYSLHSSDALS